MKQTINEFGEQVITMTLDERGPLSQEELQMLRNAQTMDPVFDEDCPPMPEEMHLEIQRNIANKRRTKSSGV